jgi:excisionase family DNA binding protein
VPEALLNIHDVSTYLGIPVPTLYQWRYMGKGPRAARLGRHLRYRLGDVDAWVDAQANVNA